MKAYNYSEDKLKRLIAETSQLFFEQNFPSRSSIEGQEILHFSGNYQVNRFLLFQIYQEWNLYIAKIKHPYFDFQHSEVREALVAFQNILSQHIRVDKSDFKPLLDKAIYNTFRLILQPLDLLVGFFFLNKNSVSLAQFERYAPYFVDFDFVVGSLLTYYQKNQIHEIDRNDFIHKAERLAELFEKRTEQSLDEYRGILFHKLTGREIKTLLESNSFSEPKNVFTPDELNSLLSEALNPATNFVKAKQADPTGDLIESPALVTLEHTSRATSEQVRTIQKEIEDDVTEPHRKQIAPTKDTPARALESQTVASSQPPQPTGRLVDQFQGQGSTLNSLFNKKGSTSQILVETIPMHKQFQYVQKVFAGNRKLFKDTIDAINQLPTQEEALKYLQTRILNMPEVKRDEPVVEEFLELIRSRY